MMKITITQKYDADSINESELLFVKEATQDQFDKLSYWGAVEYFINAKLDNDKKVIVDLILEVEGEETEYLDSKSFDSIEMIKEGTFVVIIPNISPATIVEVNHDISQSVFYGQHKLWDMHSSYTFDKAMLEAWVKIYIGHKYLEIKRAFNNL